MDKKRKAISAAELSGQSLVFTGKLQITRKEAIAFVQKMGCRVQSSVTRKTTILVLGSQEEKRLRQGHRRSLKHDAARKRIKGGQKIRIIPQEEFYQLIDCPIQLSLLDLVSKPAEGKALSVQKTAPQPRSTKKSKICPAPLERGSRLGISSLSRTQAPQQ